MSFSSVILSGPNDWDECLEMIKAKTKTGKNWGFVNPALAKEELTELTQPEILKAKDINPEKTTIIELTDIKLD